MKKKKAPLFFAGIDYGSKTAGTTVIAFPDENDLVHFAGSPVKGNADRFIRDWCAQHHPGRLYIDAPLSLPGVYRWPEQYGDYFYRKADRSVSAMSPMFLGGLTARAMKLSAELNELNIETKEVYPSRLAAELGFDKKQYKKVKKYLYPLSRQLCSQLPFATDPASVIDWHHFDALLALFSGWRHQNEHHLLFGEGEEGYIIV